MQMPGTEAKFAEAVRRGNVIVLGEPTTHRRPRRRRCYLTVDDPRNVRVAAERHAVEAQMIGEPY